MSIPSISIESNSSLMEKIKNNKGTIIGVIVGLVVLGVVGYVLYVKFYKKKKNPVDCQISDNWYWDSNCNCDSPDSSGMGYKTGHKNIIQEGSDGGKACPDPTSDDLFRRESCSCGSGGGSIPSPSPSSSGSIPSPSPSSSGSTQLNGDIFLYQRYGIGPINLYVRGSNLSVSRNDFSTAAINYKYGPIKYELDSNTFVADYGNGDLQTYVYNPQDNTILEKSTNIIFTTNVAPV